MKWAVIIWLFCGGIGVSFSILRERKGKLEMLFALEEALKKLHYYMCERHIPPEEMLRELARENGILSDFYKCLQEQLMEKRIEDFGSLWQRESRLLWQKAEPPGEVRALWETCFFHMPTHTDAIGQRLIRTAEEILHKGRALEEKYRSEQRLVVSLGFFLSAFFCLMLW